MTPRCHQRCSSPTDPSMVNGVLTQTQRRLRRLFAALAIAAALLLPAAAPADAAPSPATAPSWAPSPSDRWQYQLQGTIDRNVDADVFDVDAFDVSKDTVAALHAKGRHVVCYVDAGSWEPYRPDKD